MKHNIDLLSQIPETSMSLQSEPEVVKMSTKCYIFEQARLYFESKYLSRVGPWTMTLAVLACGFLLRKRAIIVLEGNPYVTNKIALEILAFFPPGTVHEENVDVDALLATDFSTTRIVYLPEIDDKKRVMTCFHKWTAKEGYAYEYTVAKEEEDEIGSGAQDLRLPQGEKERKKKVFGHVAIIATCEKASSIPRGLRDAGWVVPVVLTDDESIATIIVENGEYTVDSGDTDLPAEVGVTVPDPVVAIKNGLLALPSLQPHVPFAEDLADIFVTGSTEKVLDHLKVMALLVTIAMLDAGAHYIFQVLETGQLAILVEIDDVTKLQELVSPIMARQQALKPDEEHLLDIVKEEQEGEKWLPTASITAKTGTTFAYHDKTIHRMLDRLVRKGYLLKKVEGKGLPNSYKIASAVNLDPITDEMRKTMKTKYGDFLNQLKQDKAKYKVFQVPEAFPGNGNAAKGKGGVNK